MRRAPALVLITAVALAGAVLGGGSLSGPTEATAQTKKAAKKPAKKGAKKGAKDDEKVADEESAKEGAAGESKVVGAEPKKKGSGPEVVDVKSQGDGGIKTYKFGPVEVEGRLKSPQVVYFLRRVRAEFAAGDLGHRSFMRELSDTRRNPAIH